MLCFGKNFANKLTFCPYSKAFFNRKFPSLFSAAVHKADEKMHALTLNGDEKEHSSRIVRIVDEIASLTLLEVADLNELLAKRLNIKAPVHAVTPMSPQPASPKEHEEREEVEQAPSKTAYAVKLMKFDATKKVALIKEIKNILPDMNLVQAKKFVEAAPGVLKKDLSKDEAEQIKRALEACGAAALYINFLQFKTGLALASKVPQIIVSEVLQTCWESTDVGYLYARAKAGRRFNLVVEDGTRRPVVLALSIDKLT
ncbi:39S ribosomal protein L12, mitochondrial [Echinococcus granulosus]|uniref:39S ribosomal protein L12 mitochondrial n=1 Tax=Echinococcus granulosus TaxID=6210 RepID=A0A068WDH9_ECHGR|nr:39S ribosomal protein L12, mitochondrial [Echinococcus granulosus]CDS16492.1 39S ribosomal protein L12 mitochondrial [Echinococcus granulosus]